MTPDEFLRLACEFALLREERMVNEEQFHPILRDCGLSPNEIESLTAALAARRDIKRFRVIGGFADFEITRPVFVNYVLRGLPVGTVSRARELCKAWLKPGGGDVTAARLAAELNVPSFQSQVLLEVSTNQRP
jgi:hypothetical protein